MSQPMSNIQICAAAFWTVEDADRAIRRLREAGFPEEQLAVICPGKFKNHFDFEVGISEIPSADAPETMVAGGAIGATLGGLALAAVAIGGGPAGLLAGSVLIGGGALAGGLSSLLVEKGYEVEADDDFKKAVRRGQIVVGVEIPDEEAAEKFPKAQQILDECEGQKTHGPVSFRNS